MIDIELYKKSMEVGYLFWNKYKNDERVYEWNATVECSDFCENIIRSSNNTGKSISEIFFDTSEQIIETINNKTMEIIDHDWDEYCKGFLAGEILGMPTDENMKLVAEAEKLWEDPSYGYYQEVLEEVKI